MYEHKILKFIVIINASCKFIKRLHECGHLDFNVIVEVHFRDKWFFQPNLIFNVNLLSHENFNLFIVVTFFFSFFLFLLRLFYVVTVPTGYNFHEQQSGNN